MKYLSVRVKGRDHLGDLVSCKWKDRHNFKMNLKVSGLGDVDWIHLAQASDRWLDLVNTPMNLRTKNPLLKAIGKIRLYFVGYPNVQMTWTSHLDCDGDTIFQVTKTLYLYISSTFADKRWTTICNSPLWDLRTWLQSMSLLDCQDSLMTRCNCNGIQQEICHRCIEPCLGRQKKQYDYSPTPSMTTRFSTSSHNLLFVTICTVTQVTRHFDCSHF
jgi:hypothetical protein